MSLRWFLRDLRRRARRYRLLLTAFVTALAAVLSTLYESIPPGLRVTAVAVMGVLTGATVLLVESPHAVPDRLPFDGTRAGRGTARQVGLWARSLRSALSGLRSPWRRPVMRVLPPVDSGFRGRERDLVHLVDWHDEQRKARDPAGSRPARDGVSGRHRAAGPVLVLVHGMPGVGKSALALQLANRLTGQYPDGALYVNLGTSGAARTPADILKQFLLALNAEVPETTLARAMTFRSLTAKKRILYVLDAARHADQVRQVLPNDPAAGVIVTSRRDLSADPSLTIGETSYRLDVPDHDDAMRIFRAVSDTDESTRPGCAAEIVELCGRLPSAIRAAGERVFFDGTDICHVAGLLRPRGTRLRWLDRPGRPVSALVQSEYGRLLPDEQLAFALLGLVPSDTFSPLVLQHLMRVPAGQAEALVDRLVTAQLVEDVGSDPATELSRYRLRPLVRLMAQEEAAKLPGGVRGAAGRRLAQANRELVAAVLVALDESYRPDAVADRSQIGSKLAARIAERPEPWVRAEYPILLEIMNGTAPRPDERGDGGELRWRIANLLGACVSEQAGTEATIAAYERAERDAAASPHRLALVEVLLAKGAFLTAIERHPQACATLDRARGLAATALDDSGQPLPGAARCAAAALRRKGEAYLQAALYQRAIPYLHQALDLTPPGHEDRQLVELLIAQAHHVDSPNIIGYDHVLDEGGTDSYRFRALLSLAEAARRREDWQRAEDRLDQALRYAERDLRRTASVQYRLARLVLERHQARLNDRRRLTGAQAPDAARAVRRAASAVVAFEQMGNRIGVIRAQCLLSRAILATGRPTEAEHVAHAAEQELAALSGVGSGAEMQAPLVARTKRATAELRLHTGQVWEAKRLLTESAAIFSENHDWAEMNEVLRLLNRIAGAGAATPALPAGTGPAAYPAPAGMMPAADAVLAPGARDALANQLTVRLLEHLDERLPRPRRLPAPVAFRGALGAALSGGVEMSSEDSRHAWRVPRDTPCQLTVSLVTGSAAYAAAKAELADHAELPRLPTPRAWCAVLVANGEPAADIDVDMFVDAPFVELTAARRSIRCAVRDDRVIHETAVLVREEGRYELRITLISAGRLVQALPVDLVCDGGPADG